MSYSRLYLLVEGDDDERFVERVITPRLRFRYDHIQTWQYAKKKPEKVESFLRSIDAMGADYYLLADIDTYACLPLKRAALVSKFVGLNEGKAVVVVREIESWYIAGLAKTNRLGVRATVDTSTLTKEKFVEAMPKAFDSRINFMTEILADFDVRTAARRNASFRYFARRCKLLGVKQSTPGG